jgi:hypothetical protein
MGLTEPIWPVRPTLLTQEFRKARPALESTGRTSTRGSSGSRDSKATSNQKPSQVMGTKATRASSDSQEQDSLLGGRDRRDWANFRHAPRGGAWATVGAVTAVTVAVASPVTAVTVAHAPRGA